jgi:hypothetical protein
MKRIELLTLASDEPRVTEAVGEMGVLHLTRAPADAGLPAEDAAADEEQAAHLDALEARAAALCRSLGLDADERPHAVPEATLFEIEGELNRIEAEIAEILAEREALRRSREQIEKLLHDTAVLRQIEAPVEQLEDLSFLHFAIGGLSSESAADVESQLGDRAVVLPYRDPFGESKVIAISSKKGR